MKRLEQRTAAESVDGLTVATEHVASPSRATVAIDDFVGPSVDPGRSRISTATRGSADATVAVIVLSILALAAAAATALPWSMESRDPDRAGSPELAAAGDPARSLLAGSARGAGGEHRRRRIRWDAAIADASWSDGPLVRGVDDVSSRWDPSLPGWLQERRDDVLSVIDRQTGELAAFSDDEAILYADLDDEAYRSSQEHAIAERAERRAQRERGESVPGVEPTIAPPRDPFDVEAFLRNSERSEAAAAPTVDEIVESLQRARGVELTVERVLETLDRRREARAEARRQAVREFRYQRARLRPDLLRECAARRGSRRTCDTEADVQAYWSACTDWNSRQRRWIEASLEGDEDERMLEALVRSIPSRSVVPPPDETRPVDPERQRRWQELVEARCRPDGTLRAKDLRGEALRAKWEALLGPGK